MHFVVVCVNGIPIIATLFAELGWGTPSPLVEVVDASEPGPDEDVDEDPSPAAPVSEEVVVPASPDAGVESPDVDVAPVESVVEDVSFVAVQFAIALHCPYLLSQVWHYNKNQ